MAVLNESDQLLAGTHQRYFRGVEDTLTEENVGMNMLKRRGRIVTGKTGSHLDWRVRTQYTSTIKGWRDLDEIDFIRESNYDTAALNWKGYAGSYTISRWDKTLNGGDEAIFNIQEQEMRWLEEGFVRTMEEGFWDDGTAQTGNKGLTGVQAFVANTGTYADIALTNSYWQAQVVDGDAGPNTDFASDAIERCATAYLQAGRGGGVHGQRRNIHAWFTDRTTWVLVHSAIQTNERFGYGKDEDTASAGFQNVLVMGVPMYWADAHPSAKIHGLNFDVIDLCVAGPRMIETTEESTINPQAFVGVTTSICQLRCTSPRYNVVITNTD
jgi:hypothetical protein